MPRKKLGKSPAPVDTAAAARAATPKEAQRPLAPSMHVTPPPNDAQTTPTFSPLIHKKLNPTTLGPVIEPLISRASASKRNFSRVSAASGESIRDAKAAKADLDSTDNQFQAIVFQAMLEEIDAGADIIEAELDITEAAIKLLVDEYNEGALDITSVAKEKEIMLLEKRARDLRSQLVVRRCQKSQMAGEVVDKMVLDNSEAPLFVKDWSYIDLLISRYRAPANATLDIFRPRDPKAQDRFRATVFKAYGAKGRTSCCITGGLIDVAAAHIVPYNIGENNATYLFGESTHKDGHIMCPQNGLPMLKWLEEAFDKGRFTIIPGDNLDEWKVIMLDEEIADDPIYKPIHGKALMFQADFRPARRYLYFAHIVTILRRQRYESTGWWKDMPPGIPEVWATPGEYLRKSALMVLARRVGHMAPKDAAELLGVSDDVGNEGPSRRARLFSDIISLSPGRGRELVTLEGSEDPFVSPGLSNPFSALQTSGDDDVNTEDE
ncbi:hypothetical protein B0T25DRAFT_524426, partial [Lasiosphaeria hispida]